MVLNVTSSLAFLVPNMIKATFLHVILHSLFFKKNEKNLEFLDFQPCVISTFGRVRIARSAVWSKIGRSAV